MATTACSYCAQPIEVSPYLLNGTPRYCNRVCSSNARRVGSEIKAARARAGAVRYVHKHKEVLRDRLRAWRAANPEKYLAQLRRNANRARANRDNRLARAREWRRKNLEKARAKSRMRKKANRAKYTAWQNARNARKQQAMPAWADRAAIQRIYNAAAAAGMEVDHIVPLSSPLVCGLHWEGNLQLLSPTENARKKNRWWPDMPVSRCA